MRSTVVWRVLVPVVLLLIGLLVATSARLATGTDLRAERRTDLVDLIRAEQQRVEAETNTSPSCSGRSTRPPQPR